jgi:hypothetical protein
MIPKTNYRKRVSTPSNHSFYGSCGGNDYLWLYLLLEILSALDYQDLGHLSKPVEFRSQQRIR